MSGGTVLSLVATHLAAVVNNSNNNNIGLFLYTGSSPGCKAHGVAQVMIHSQVVSQGTGVVNVHNADMAMH
jgi:hypothetical protein